MTKLKTPGAEVVSPGEDYFSLCQALTWLATNKARPSGLYSRWVHRAAVREMDGKTVVGAGEVIDQVERAGDELLRAICNESVNLVGIKGDANDFEPIPIDDFPSRSGDGFSRRMRCFPERNQIGPDPDRVGLKDRAAWQIMDWMHVHALTTEVKALRPTPKGNVARPSTEPPRERRGERPGKRPGKWIGRLDDYLKERDERRDDLGKATPSELRIDFQKYLINHQCASLMPKSRQHVEKTIKERIASLGLDPAAA